MNEPLIGAGCSLRVVPGEGRLARRATALLFTPDADGSELIHAFDAVANDADAVAAVLELLVQSEFNERPFALVTWDTDVHIVVFGPVEVVTSLKTVPMISGAGSGTWVEHRVTDVGAQMPVVIGAGGRADGSSDLRLGLAPAGGFELTLSPGRAPAVSAGDRVEPTASRPVLVPDLPNEVGAEPEDDPTEPGPAVQTTEPVVVEEPDRLVEAALCTAGHPNPPLHRTCRVCGLATGVDADGAPTPASFISQPTLGRLVFADGLTIELDESMVIGRKPSSDVPGERVVPVRGDDVSRRHVRVGVRDWDVFIADLSSRNGTFLRVGDDPTPVRLDPGVEQLLEAATTIHLGSADVAFRFEQNW